MSFVALNIDNMLTKFVRVTELIRILFNYNVVYVCLTERLSILSRNGVVPRPQGVLSFFSYVGSGQHPSFTKKKKKKYQEFQDPSKIFEVLVTPKIPPIL